LFRSVNSLTAAVALAGSRSAIAQYGYRLRHYRKKTDLSQDALGARFGVTGQMIGHIETAKRGTTLDMSKGFDKLFGLDSYFEELWWHVRREQTPNWFREYAEAESRASSIRLFEPLLVTGLLQIEAYAREVLRAGQREDRLDDLVSSRLVRQEILEREQPPWLVVLFLEAVVRRVVGGPEVMRDQHQRLLDAAKQPNIAIHVIPDRARAYPSGGFTLFSFEDAADVAHVEGVGGHGRMIEQGSHVERLKVLFDLIRSEALPVETSAELIRAAMEGR
jgi:transcriptional regulator with XRE-family HTH domain